MARAEAAETIRPQGAPVQAEAATVRVTARSTDTVAMQYLAGAVAVEVEVTVLRAATAVAASWSSG
jgi:hypothetical protein